jgi:hypothetical protein
MHDATDRELVAEAIAHARAVAALRGAKGLPADGGDVLETSVQVLLDLDLSDEAIAAYLLRFNILHMRASAAPPTPRRPDHLRTI